MTGGKVTDPLNARHSGQSDINQATSGKLSDRLSSACSIVGKVAVTEVALGSANQLLKSLTNLARILDDGGLES